MGFHNVQFPPKISYGTDGGPGFNTKIFELDSGAERAVQRWSRPRWAFDAVKGISEETDIIDIKDFYLARRGPANSFRWKDFNDYDSTTLGVNGPTAFDDQVIGAGDGNTRMFQLVKVYTSGNETFTRNIEKPVSGTVEVGVNGVKQTTGFTVNHETGIVTFDTAPAVAEGVTAGFEFDVPVRFGLEVDRQLPLTIAAFRAGSIQSIPLVEVHSDLLQPEQFWHGGAIEHQSVTADYALAFSEGLFQRFDIQAASLDISCPVPGNLQTGPRQFYIENSGIHTVDIVTTETVPQVVKSLAAGNITELILTVDTFGAKTWRAKGG